MGTGEKILSFHSIGCGQQASLGLFRDTFEEMIWQYLVISGNIWKHMDIPLKYQKTEKMLSLLTQIEKKRELLENFSQKTKVIEESLLLRRKEILNIIRDHEVVSSDFIMRRFLVVSPRMIRYDLKKLEEQGFIIKLGITRGALYKIK